MAVCDWKIVYSGSNAVEMRALEFLYGEMGNFMLRDWGVYALYTMPCEKASDTLPETNAVVIGTLKENPLLQKFIRPGEVPPNGFRIRKVQNPLHPEKELLLIAANDPAAVLYGTVTFIDDILVQESKSDGNGVTADADVCHLPLAEIDLAEAPATRIRSVFTWAHPIGNMYEYFRNLARLKFNRVYMWNEFPPLNAAEVVDYAHSWGIEVFWGFAWGWSTNCCATNISNIAAMKQSILQEYYSIWAKLPGDGIYFQSFTEMAQRELNGRPVADSVVELVNSIAAQLLAAQPELKIVFGLHASSVKEDLDAIAKSDPRLEILWEDCGNYPFNRIKAAPTPAEDQNFVRRLLAQKHTMGLVYKCQLVQKWENFAHQAGSYILGHNGSKMQANDLAVVTSSWKYYKAVWHELGEIAYDLTRMIQSEGGADIEMNVAAQLNGPIHWPTAMTAELFWQSDRPFAEIIRRAQRKGFVL